MGLYFAQQRMMTTDGAVLRLRLWLLRLLSIMVVIGCVVSSAAAADNFYGTVVSISDGDTITVLTAAKQQIKVRLAEIDTPEKGQPYGTAARQALAAKVFQQQVTVAVDTVDRYGRQVGHIYVGSRNINREMVAEGHAWAYRRYLKDKGMLTLEDNARVAGLGLWGMAEASHTPPWEWRQQSRRGNRGRADSTTVVTDSTAGGQCGSKRYCREMANCAEAKFYLNTCGLRSLDGDADGNPCETLCR